MAHRNIPFANQQGVVLLIALIVLVAMTLAGIALVRSVDTGNLAAGNLAFRQGAALTADRAIEEGITWLDARQADGTLDNNVAASGYYATSQDSLDVTNRKLSGGAVDWGHDNCDGLDIPSGSCVTPSNAVEVKEGGAVLYSYSYIIHRLCSEPTSYKDKDNSCVTHQGAEDESPNRDAPKIGQTRFSSPPVPYYRVTVRVLGPRNTTSFVQAVVHY